MPRNQVIGFHLPLSLLNDGCRSPAGLASLFLYVIHFFPGQVSLLVRFELHFGAVVHPSLGLRGHGQRGGRTSGGSRSSTTPRLEAYSLPIPQVSQLLLQLARFAPGTATRGAAPANWRAESARESALGQMRGLEIRSDWQEHLLSRASPLRRWLREQRTKLA